MNQNPRKLCSDNWLVRATANITGTRCGSAYARRFYSAKEIDSGCTGETEQHEPDQFLHLPVDRRIETERPEQQATEPVKQHLDERPKNGLQKFFHAVDLVSGSGGDNPVRGPRH
ncbi:MAG: hypothetical protein JNM89_02055 [Hyphomicrobiaceae bacterium]|nr:hypothetical protein [Hyphomicrobiaceae bacterium]